MSTTVVPSTLPGDVPLSEYDPDLYDLIEKEKVRLGSGYLTHVRGLP